MAAKLHWWEWDNALEDGIHILDPDGFCGSRKEYNDLYTQEEFEKRRHECTCSFDPSLMGRTNDDINDPKIGT